MKIRTEIQEYKIGDHTELDETDYDGVDWLDADHYEDNDIKVWRMDYSSGIKFYVHKKNSETGEWKELGYVRESQCDYNEDTHSYEIDDEAIKRLTNEDTDFQQASNILQYGLKKLRERADINYSNKKYIRERHRQKFAALDQQLQADISETYNNSLSPYENCTLLKECLLDNADNVWFSILEEDRDYWRYPWDDPDFSYNSIPKLDTCLKVRQIIMSLPTKYRKMFDIDSLDQRINDLDETVLNQYRGLVSTNEIKDNLNINRESA